jgi:hypothetical protein
VRTRGRILLLRPEEVDWIDGRGNYAQLHVNGEIHRVPSRSYYSKLRELFVGDFSDTSPLRSRPFVGRQVSEVRMYRRRVPASGP